MAFDLRGRNAVFMRPATGAPGSEGATNSLWARNKSSEGAADGYEFVADDLNEIIGQLRALLQALGGDVAGTMGNELAEALTTSLEEKLSIASGLGGLPDDEEFVRMTVEERTKLAALNEGFKGSYTAIASLQVAHPTGVAGDWAILQNGSGSNATVAIWDADNATPSWVNVGVTPATLDWAAITGKPSTFTPSTHSHAQTEITGLTSALAALVPQTRAVNTSGLASGGGALSADRTINVPIASVTQVRAATDNGSALTIKQVADAAAPVTLTDAATIALDMATFNNAIVTLGGNRTLGNPTNAVVGKGGKIRVVQDATGGRTLAFSSNWKFVGGVAPSLSTAPGARDDLYYYVDASNDISASLDKDVK